VRDEKFQNIFDPLNGFIYLSLFAALIINGYTLFLTEAQVLSRYSFIGIAATSLKAIILLLKKPRRLLQVRDI